MCLDPNLTKDQIIAREAMLIALGIIRPEPRPKSVWDESPYGYKFIYNSVIDTDWLLNHCADVSQEQINNQQIEICKDGRKTTLKNSIKRKDLREILK